LPHMLLRNSNQLFEQLFALFYLYLYILKHIVNTFTYCLVFKHVDQNILNSVFCEVQD